MNNKKKGTKNVHLNYGVCLRIYLISLRAYSFFFLFGFCLVRISFSLDHGNVQLNVHCFLAWPHSTHSIFKYYFVLRIKNNEQNKNSKTNERQKRKKKENNKFIACYCLPLQWNSVSIWRTETECCFNYFHHYRKFFLLFYEILLIFFLFYFPL